MKLSIVKPLHKGPVGTNVVWYHSCQLLIEDRNCHLDIKNQFI